MKNVSVQLSNDYVETLDDEANELDLSRAQYIRELIEQGREADATQAELEATQARLDDLRRQLQEANRQNRDVDGIVAYVEEERQLQRRREEREQRREQRRSAPAWRRAKWWLFGTPDDKTAE